VHKYTIDDKIQTANIYSMDNNSDKILFFICGGTISRYSEYINKTIIDLFKYHSNIISNYNIYIFEKLDKSSYEIHNDINQYIEHINAQKPISELVLFGFSSGGITANHIMVNFNDYTFKKKIITYDSSMTLFKSTRYLQNTIMRVDKCIANNIKTTYQNHWNWNTLKDKINTDWDEGYNAIQNNLMSIHNHTYETYAKRCSIDYNLSSDVLMINIFSKYDPLILNTYIYHSLEKYKSKIKFNFINIEKNNISHCSDMLFSTKYLDNIIIALNSQNSTKC
jgi:hypothetical protein